MNAHGLARAERRRFLLELLCFELTDNVHD
jgi:hypothetical protein